MQLANSAARDALAAEYALGALHGQARRRFERYLRRDADLRARVECWLSDVLPLAAAAGTLEPSARAWEGIAARIGINGAARRAVPVDAPAAPQAMRPPPDAAVAGLRADPVADARDAVDDATVGDAAVGKDTAAEHTAAEHTTAGDTTAGEQAVAATTAAVAASTARGFGKGWLVAMLVAGFVAGAAAGPWLRAALGF